MKTKTLALLPLVVLFGLATAFCGDDDNANDRMIGAQCLTATDCDDHNDDTAPLECLTEFSGGYCGDASCIASTDCPDGSVCVGLDGSTYCFLVCNEKADCNQNRDLENEANCSSNVDPVEGGNIKVCVPPSSGI